MISDQMGGGGGKTVRRGSHKWKRGAGQRERRPQRDGSSNVIPRTRPLSGQAQNKNPWIIFVPYPGLRLASKDRPVNPVGAAEARRGSSRGAGQPHVIGPDGVACEVSVLGRRPSSNIASGGPRTLDLRRRRERDSSTTFGPLAVIVAIFDLIEAAKHEANEDSPEDMQVETSDESLVEGDDMV
ncbi:hypothetical protein Bca52824_047593 [Brassica carinata]|uniref:Uncharacterized protein n=1 Tax=Brassica carinata TaxID=52824 RepID=A0A8X7RF39_BRACI|nr:hypothetical protein Bca52824_047593 [Brassica carinata]